MTTPVLVLFRVRLLMRYTRISCRPFGASKSCSRLVRAVDAGDAIRQACLCVDRDLEDVLAHVNASNVSEVIVEIEPPELVDVPHVEPVWNGIWYAADRAIPRHIVVRQRPRGG